MLFRHQKNYGSTYKQGENLQAANEDLLTSPYFIEIGGKEPRYYQQLAVNRIIEAIARGQKRCLLVIATGAGKTYTVFNIIWRLWKTKVVKRVLFLADRNALVDQTITNDFRPFGEVMTKLDSRLVDNQTGRINTSYEIYLGLYQAIIGNRPLAKVVAGVLWSLEKGARSPVFCDCHA